MVELKTKATDASVEQYIASRAKAGQKSDCDALMAMFQRITGQPPRMWVPSIVGYGSYQYTYDSGRTGEMCLAGFAIRGRELVVYLNCEDPCQAVLLSKLGKHRMTKSCLYFKRLSDLDQHVLAQLVVDSIDKLSHRHGQDGDV